MKYIFRDIIIFEYIPTNPRSKVIQHKISDTMSSFDYCAFIPDDYKLLSEFFDTVYRHIQGEDVDLKDIQVY